MHLFVAVEYHGMSPVLRKWISEVTIMCNGNGFCGGGIWWIIILAVLFCCCGNGNGLCGANACGNGCERTCC